MITRKQALRLIKEKPVQIAYWCGFDKLGELHNEWLKTMLFGKEDYTLQAHRLSYKTTCISVALALYMICFPSKNEYFLRKTDTDVTEIITQVQKMLLQPKIRVLANAIWGRELTILSSTQNTITTSLYTSPRGTAQLVGQGIGGSMTGKHFDLIVTDDIVNLKDRVSKAERERTKDAYRELINILNHGGRMFNAGTPWHKDDCFSIMPEAHKWDCYTTGIMSEELIQSKKDTLTPSLFSANYELKHIADENVLFSNPQYFDDSALLENGIAHIDASYGGEDGTAFTIIKKRGELYYVYGKLWQQHVDNCIPMILDAKKRFLTGRTWCEDNGDKGALKKDLRSAGDMASTYHETMNKHIKISTILYREWKNIRFHVDTDKAYIDQITEYNENAPHDDAPDSLASALVKLSGGLNVPEGYKSLT